MNRQRGIAVEIYATHNKKLFAASLVTEVFIVVGGVVLYAVRVYYGVPTLHTLSGSLCVRHVVH